MEPKQIRNLILLALFLILIAGSRAIADFIIEYHWWKEVGQVQTWISMLIYKILPAVIASLVSWLSLVWAHARGLRFSGASASRYPLYSRIVTLALLVVSIVFVGATIDSWRVMAYVGSLSAPPVANAWTDPVFSNNLSFYLFGLPFYGLLLRFLFTVALLSVVVFWASGRGWQLFERLQRFREDGGSVEEFDPGPNPLLLEGATRTGFARILGAIGLLAAAVWFFLGRYGMLMNSHGFMTGIDYVDETFSLPLRWLVIVSLLAAIPLLWMRRLKVAAGIVIASVALNAFAPGIVRTLYVRPNELSLERSYIQRHLEATVQAYDLGRGEERVFAASPEETLDVAEHAVLVENIRLWDTKAFTDTITQIQALRPYYRFAGVDIDRYTIDGRIKQVLLSPREIDVNQLPAEARDSWINTRFIYTHGYGVVAAEVNRTTPDGLPVLLIQDAPPEVRVPELTIERPEIYYGEMTHDPVFVSTDQEEFDYPSEKNVFSSYQGDGGFPIDSLPLRLAAAVRETSYNIVLTGLTNPNSRMMIYRNVSERLEHLAGFLEWDTDPYLVITDEGKLVWILDGYTVSGVHPYSVALTVNGKRVNYVRNSIKATVDAYNGETLLYIFDPSDPIIQAYKALFPDLFHDQEEMPPSLRQHVRYPLLMFQIQAEIYRTFHMKDPAVFYNKEDVWEIAHSLWGDTGEAVEMRPTYVVATLPDEEEPEFLLMLPFTPLNKDNLIGWMAARCDGDRLGELVFFQLSKQQLVFGPNQIESRINQHEQIAKDFTLWNQQGSRVLRGEMLALPVGDTFLYVESIYIQADNARMPQLKKVVLAMGNRLIYEDTFEEALDRLSGGGALARVADAAEGGAQAAAPRAAGEQGGQRLRGLARRLSELRRQAEQMAEDLGRMESDLER